MSKRAIAALCGLWVGCAAQVGQSVPVVSAEEHPVPASAAPVEESGSVTGRLETDPPWMTEALGAIREVLPNVEVVELSLVFSNGLRETYLARVSDPSAVDFNMLVDHSGERFPGILGRPGVFSQLECNGWVVGASEESLAEGMDEFCGEGPGVTVWSIAVVSGAVEAVSAHHGCSVSVQLESNTLSIDRDGCNSMLGASWWRSGNVRRFSLRDLQLVGGGEYEFHGGGYEEGYRSEGWHLSRGAFSEDSCGHFEQEGHPPLATGNDVGSPSRYQTFQIPRVENSGDTIEEQLTQAVHCAAPLPLQTQVGADFLGTVPEADAPRVIWVGETLVIVGSLGSAPLFLRNDALADAWPHWVPFHPMTAREVALDGQPVLLIEAEVPDGLHLQIGRFATYMTSPGAQSCSRPLFDAVCSDRGSIPREDPHDQATPEF